MLQYLIERLLCLNYLLPRAGAIRSPGAKTAEPSHRYTAAKGIRAASSPKARAKTTDCNGRD
jgi:hypothetical protein